MAYILASAGVLAAAVSGTLAADGTPTAKEVDRLRQQLADVARKVAERDEQIRLLQQDIEEKPRVGRPRQLAGDDLADLAPVLDAMWLLLCGFLVLFMQAGFKMLEAGCCRAKHAAVVAMKGYMHMCMGSITWFIVGYTLAYLGDYNRDGTIDVHFFGYKEFYCFNFTSKADGHYVVNAKHVGTNPFCHWFFSCAQSLVPATIASGAFSERIYFEGYVIYTFFMSITVYPLLAAWVWGGGWLATEVNSVGAMDFAGGGVVHLTGGVAALLAAYAAGPRQDRWTDPAKYKPHNMPLVLLGTHILWFSWYGFNCGALLGMSSERAASTAALVVMNTTLAASAGGLTATLLSVIRLAGKFNILAVCNGILAGLVSISAPCSNVDVGSALAIGCVGGIIYTCSSALVERAQIDDPVDAASVHGACGVWSVLAAALFDWGGGFSQFHGWSGFGCVRARPSLPDEEGPCDEDAFVKAFIANIIEILVVITWTALLSGMTFSLLHRCGLLRVVPGDDVHYTDSDKRETPMEATMCDEHAYIM